MQFFLDIAHLLPCYIPALLLRFIFSQIIFGGLKMVNPLTCIIIFFKLIYSSYNHLNYLHLKMLSLCLCFWFYNPWCSLLVQSREWYFVTGVSLLNPVSFFCHLDQRGLLQLSYIQDSSVFIFIISVFLGQLGFSQPKLCLNSISSKNFSLILYSTKFNFECFKSVITAV